MPAMKLTTQQPSNLYDRTTVRELRPNSRKKQTTHRQLEKAVWKPGVSLISTNHPEQSPI
jgi:hypothetical protein